MKNIEIEGQLNYLDQLIDKTLSLTSKIESSTDDRLEYYKCSLTVPLNMDLSQFVQEITDWCMWSLDLSPTKKSFFISGIIVSSLQYNSETRVVSVVFTFPNEYEEAKAKFSNRFLNLAFKNFASWKNRLKNYHERILDLYRQSESYYANPKVVTDVPNAMDYLYELLKE